MGLSSSKDASAASSSAAPTPAPALGVVRRTRVFQSSCLGGGRHSHSYQSDNNNNPPPPPLDYTNHQNNKENGSLSHDHPTSAADEDDDDADDDQDYNEEEEDEDQASQQVLKREESSTDDDRSSSQEDAPSRSNRLRSRFTFEPGNLGFRLHRAASFRSTSSRPSRSLFANNAFTTGTTAAAATQQQPLLSIIRNQGSNLLPIPLCTTSDATNSDPCTNFRTTCHPHNNVIVSTQNDHPCDFNNENTGVLPDPDYHTSSIDNNDIEFLQSRRATRRIEDREPVERSVRFSRTLSVGRLRDRVLHRSSFTDGLFGHLQQEREVAGSSMESRSQVLARMPDSNENADISPASSTHTLPPMSNSMFTNQSDRLEISRPREARYHDIMEHRTDFLERRRRIRSQVRALQRLNSRFENLSGHERSCILAGQHRSGRCTCRTSIRARNADDDTSARASISRIVMLAEALFEVLDEIHQQSVGFSSRPSVSSLGSIPAPKEVVESMPVKIYAKLQKHQPEDVAQCYICLLEYDEGDCMRILPCRHEFHVTCIDKWLKEIHRVCPLCRGDVCRSDTLTSTR